MRMKLSKHQCLLHVSTIALSGLLFTNTTGVMNAAESHDISNESSAQQSVMVQNQNAQQTHANQLDISNQMYLADADTNAADQSHTANADQNHSTTSTVHAEENSQTTNVEQSNAQNKTIQNTENQKSAAATNGQTGEDESIQPQSKAASHDDLPEAGHVDHPEQGAVITIIIGIVISTIALIRLRRQNP